MSAKKREKDKNTMLKECGETVCSSLSSFRISRGPSLIESKVFEVHFHDKKLGPCEPDRLLLSFQLDEEDDAGSSLMSVSRSQLPATFDCRYLSIAMLMTRPHSG